MVSVLNLVRKNTFMHAGTIKGEIGVSAAVTSFLIVSIRYLIINLPNSQREVNEAKPVFPGENNYIFRLAYVRSDRIREIPLLNP
jgi:hypothetical protein